MGCGTAKSGDGYHSEGGFRLDRPSGTALTDNGIAQARLRHRTRAGGAAARCFASPAASEGRRSQSQGQVRALASAVRFVAATRVTMREVAVSVSRRATRSEAMRCVTVINRNLFKMAFCRDVDYHDMYPQSTYLDRQTDDNLWLYECDEDARRAVMVPAEENREGWERIEVEPERYLRIPGLGHGDHYEILREFLRSDWTGDEARRGRVADANSGSIGRCKRDACDEGQYTHSMRFRKCRSRK